MVRNLVCGVLLALALSLMSACSDKGGEAPAPTPAPTITGETVEIADLANATWGDTTASANATCLANSSFLIKKGEGFSIQQNPKVTKQLKNRAIIVSPVTIVFSGEDSDGRGANCPDGAAAFTVPVNENTPIGIEADAIARARQNPEIIARAQATDFPRCNIYAHFEKSGIRSCGSAVPDDETDDDQAGDDQTGDDETGDDDQAGDDTDDDNDGLVLIPGLIHKPDFKKLPEFSKAITYEPKLPCGKTEVRTVKMVIDDVDCRMQ